MTERTAQHSPMCDAIYGDGDPCNCELGALRGLATAAGEIVHIRLLPCGNCQGDLEQSLIDAHQMYLERIT